MKFGVFLLSVFLITDLFSQTNINPILSISNNKSAHQLSMTVWKHPSIPSKSLIISSDQKGQYIFVYDMKGRLLDSVQMAKPGHIDLRYGFKVLSKEYAIVAFHAPESDPQEATDLMFNIECNLSTHHHTEDFQCANEHP